MLCLVTLAFMLELCEPVGEVVTNTAQQRLRKARSESYFIGKTGSVIVYCTLVPTSARSAMVGCQRATGTTGPHVVKRIFSLWEKI